MTASPPLLAIDGVRKGFGSRRRSAGETTWALDDVTLDLNAGETVGVVGESGAGKSTLGRCILGLETIDTGRIRLDDRDLGRGGRDRRAIRAQIGVIFQDPYSSLNPRWTLEHSVAHPLIVGGRDRRPARALARQLLDDVGLPKEYARRHPVELSGGERQRVAIARALALEPRIVVCDEPTSALDVSVQAQIVNLLLDVQARTGVAYLFITHDIAVVRAVSDRLVVMRAGRIVEQGPCASVLSSPTDDYTRELIAAVPVPPPLKEDYP